MGQMLLHLIKYKFTTFRCNVAKQDISSRYNLVFLSRCSISYFEISKYINPIAHNFLNLISP
jgi:hypothetical protein